ncbi:MAG: hypothetical protein K2X87_02385, partial [Gemmataceae bacterium]|nr:hypothetical protein [Gemmataceae bacterium]
RGGAGGGPWGGVCNPGAPPGAGGGGVSGGRAYYYRGRRVGGRVVKEYVGAGPAADRIARHDTLTHDRRQAEAEAARRTADGLDALDAAVASLGEVADPVGRAALLAAGTHRPNRGPWRKRRARPAEDTADPAEA